MASRVGWKPAPSITVVKWWITEELWLTEADAYDRPPHEVHMYNKSENVIYLNILDLHFISIQST